MSERKFNSEMSNLENENVEDAAIDDDPIGSVMLTSNVTFGVRSAALAGIAVPADAAAGRPDPFHGLAGPNFTLPVTGCTSMTR
jgi:hypothetical protein